MAQFSKFPSECRYDQLDEKCFFCEKIINVIILSDIEGKCFSLYSKNFRRDCENSMIRIQRNVLTDRNFFLGENLFCYLSRPLSKTVGSFVERFSARLWKLHALCPYDYFYGKPFSWEKNHFSFSLGTLIEIFSAF